MEQNEEVKRINSSTPLYDISYVYLEEEDRFLYCEEKNGDYGTGQFRSKKDDTEISQLVKQMWSRERVHPDDVPLLENFIRRKDNFKLYIRIKNFLSAGDYYHLFEISGRRFCADGIPSIWSGYIKDLHQEVVAIENLQRHRMAKSLLKPHFLYNTLNIISGYTCVDPQVARDIIQTFSVYYRSIVKADPEAKPIKFSTELEMIKAYLSIQRARFGEIDVEFLGCDRDFYMPSFIALALVDNAIHYGTEKLGKEYKINIEVNESDESIHILVKNEGNDFDLEGALLLEKSIFHIRQRIKHLVNGDIKKSYENGWVIMDMCLPKEKIVEMEYDWNEDYIC